MDTLYIVLAAVQDTVIPWLVKLRCLVRGHRTTLEITRTRVYYQCVECGYESKGWDCSLGVQRGEAGDR
jgi:hypothetical protein